MIAHRFHPSRDEGGQGLTEYAFILVLVALITVGSLSFLGQALVDEFCLLTFQLSQSADLSSACGKPIVSLGPVHKGPNQLNLEVLVRDPDGDPNNPYAAISKVEFYIDATSGSPVQTELEHRYCLGGNSGLSPCHNFNTDGLSPGSHTVIVLAYDSDGNVGRFRYDFTK
ncbi:MAG TPA: Flp family type IVb pilin [Anaerolineae bacterium]|jgi:Flp pilus assembly pilin Flp|nr:Flp family type IVb pilin [Anaerolineae bacterium]